MPQLKRLPIGYSSLERIRSDDCTYVDKTHHVANLVQNGAYYFLSRPRRFGKSLLLDTIKQAFLGRRELFTGLYLEQHWDWQKKYPVIHFDFAGGGSHSREQLEMRIHQILDSHYESYQIENRYQDVSGRFSYLIEAIADKHKNNIVVLVDEYDKPILDVIDDIQQAICNREILKELYGVIKLQSAKIKFSLLTGVSKFSKVSLFSGLNNLHDITLNAAYADICGYTQDELENQFDDYLDGIDKTELKRWYNGYSFAGTEMQRVYNPFDILLFFADKGVFRRYWFETGSPTFLLKLVQATRYYLPSLENIIVGEELLDSFDIENIKIETLLFQTGYLTIVDVQVNELTRRLQYKLSYPNFEVRSGLMANLLEYFFTTNIVGLSSTNHQLTTALINKDFGMLLDILKQFFAGIPYNWYVKNDIANYEGFYAVVMYSIFNGLGVVAVPEDTTSRGRIDLTIHLPEYIILLEFKLNTLGDAASALAQIKNKGYADKYTAEGKLIYLLGISFDITSRNISEFKVESA